MNSLSCEVQTGLTLIFMERLLRFALNKLHLASPETEGRILGYASRMCREKKKALELPCKQRGQPPALSSSVEGSSETSGTLSRDWVATTGTGTIWVTSTAGTLPRGGYLSDSSSQGPGNSGKFQRLCSAPA